MHKNTHTHRHSHKCMQTHIRTHTHTHLQHPLSPARQCLTSRHSLALSTPKQRLFSGVNVVSVPPNHCETDHVYHTGYSTDSQ